MAVVLATAELKPGEAERNLRLTWSQDSLNRSYQEFEEQYNCLCSNWDWFAGFQRGRETRQAVCGRIDQN